MSRGKDFVYTYSHKRILRAAGLCIWLCMLFIKAWAQAPPADTSDKIRINIINTRDGFYFKTDSGEFRKFIGDVILTQGTDTLYCDSMLQNSTTKNLEAFGNVRIAQQGGTHGSSDYLRYTSDKKLAFMTGNVNLTDGKNNLRCAELTYDLSTKTGVYDKGGTLESDSTTVSSRSGVYNVKSKDARFTGNVVVTDPRYKITSRDLGYNTETKMETFYDSSTVTSDSGKSVLVTTQGTYDSKAVIAHFTGHSSIWNDGEYIEADSMHYNKLTGYGFAIGHVISIDTTQHATIYCGRADFFRRQRVLWATIKPVLEIANGKDTFYMRADTFYSAPMVKVLSKYPPFKMPRDTADSMVRKDSMSVKHNATDTLAGQKISGGKKAAGMDIFPKAAANADTVKKKTTDAALKGKRQKKIKDTTTTVAVTEVQPEPKEDTIWVLPATKFRLADFFKDSVQRTTVSQKVKGKQPKLKGVSKPDTTQADTTAPIYFTGYNHVKIFSDSMQAKCDSVVYTRSDSIVRMVYNPIAWSRGSQIMGDTILMQLDSNAIRSMYVPDNSIVVSQSGPEKAQIWDQVQGKTLTAFFKGNAINKMIVNPDAQSIYYSKDDNGAYLGVNEASSELMRIYFGEEKIKKIKFEKDVKQTMTPLDKADLPNTKLSRFKWLIDQKPKSKQELFD